MPQVYREPKEGASASVEKAMHERKRGTLRSSSGAKVTSDKQAIAIGPQRGAARRHTVPRKPRGIVVAPAAFHSAASIPVP
jgi:hypothetical protein